MEDTEISSLTPGGEAPELDVRVVRTWKPAFRDNETCYVFVDRQGIGIQAVAKGKDQRTVASKLQVQSCYRVKGYACAEPDKFTSTVCHPAYMRVGAATVFTPIEDTPDLPRQYFEFVSRQRLDYLYEQSKDPAQKNKRAIVDYIGILQDMHDNKTNAGAPFVTMTLKDSSNRDVSVTLWDEITTSTTKFPRSAVDTSVPPTILAITGVRVTDFIGKLQLQSTNATHVYVNPSTVETRTLLRLFEGQELAKDSTDTQSQQQKQTSVGIQNHVTISEHLRKEKNEITGNIFVLKGAFTRIATDKEWHFTACPNCDNSPIKSESVWFCSQHGYYPTPTEKYRITGIISDKTGSIHATMFNEPSTTLIGKKCSDLLSNEHPDTMQHTVLNKEAYFYVQAQKNIRTGLVRFTVNTVENINPNAPSSSTPAPKTPTSHTSPRKNQSENPVKRTLYQAEDKELAATKKQKND